MRSHGLPTSARRMGCPISSNTIPSRLSLRSCGVRNGGGTSTTRPRCSRTCSMASFRSMSGSRPTSGTTAIGSTEPRPIRSRGLQSWSTSWLTGLRVSSLACVFPVLGPICRHTLVVVTFDESDFEADYLPDLASSYDGPNHIYTVLLGDCIEPGFEEEGYNHYSLLRTIEQNFSLGHLGKNDAAANWFQFLWGRRFEWSAPQNTPFDVFDGPIGTAGFAGALFVACAAADGTVRVRARSSDHGR